MTVQNAARLLALGYLHEEKQLEKLAHEFVRTHSQAVMQTEGWAQVMQNEKLRDHVFAKHFPQLPAEGETNKFGMKWLPKW
jgi:hypothetical protein